MWITAIILFLLIRFSFFLTKITKEFFYFKECTSTFIKNFIIILLFTFISIIILNIFLLKLMWLYSETSSISLNTKLLIFSSFILLYLIVRNDSIKENISEYSSKQLKYYQLPVILFLITIVIQSLLFTIDNYNLNYFINQLSKTSLVNLSFIIEFFILFIITAWLTFTSITTLFVIDTKKNNIFVKSLLFTLVFTVISNFILLLFSWLFSENSNISLDVKLLIISFTSIP